MSEEGEYSYTLTFSLTWLSNRLRTDRQSGPAPPCTSAGSETRSSTPKTQIRRWSQRRLLRRVRDYLKEKLSPDLRQRHISDFVERHHVVLQVPGIRTLAW
jgi:hypothetical protein